MKLQKNRRSKRMLVIATLIVVAILAICATILVVDYNKYQNSIKNISVSTWGKSEYLLQEEFDTTGITVQVTLNSGKYYFVNADELTFEGFDNTKVNKNLYITVYYKGFSDRFKISVDKLPDPPKVLSHITVEGLSTTSITEWNAGRPDLTGAYILCHYTDDTTFKVGLETHHIKNWERVSAPCVFDMVVQYRENGTIKTVTVPITITN